MEVCVCVCFCLVLVCVSVCVRACVCVLYVDSWRGETGRTSQCFPTKTMKHVALLVTQKSGHRTQNKEEEHHDQTRPTIHIPLKKLPL